MIDIHSHIVFDVDDGPKSLQESIDLISESYAQGVRTIVSTSHRRKGMFEEPEEKIFENFSIVKEEAEKQFPDLQINYGGELFYTSSLLKKIENHLVPNMADTRYYLIEFSMVTPWREIQTAVKNLLAIGVTPIIAHIERYNALEFNKERVKELIALGCYTQINSSHVLKAKIFGDKHKIFKKRARFFLEENVVHCVASDMHNLDARKPFMREAYDIIAKDFGAKRANDLFQLNPQILLENDYL
ncbi:capsular polysaccharide biosynthesis protein CpsB [Streptococcus varani]|uniref:Tyrosine-protein phosphatase n=1 Tax=Streptococcus varani TaxID=1608583 RepID=A0A0E4H4D0_9STRE|nr:capsular polysaccharide biosynthesis protein Cps4B [Streptococcus varani]CQR24529.1 capsular polysaccharide biosynthesis protein CpsB [Streptococcus varani]